EEEEEEEEEKKEEEEEEKEEEDEEEEEKEEEKEKEHIKIKKIIYDTTEMKKQEDAQRKLENNEILQIGEIVKKDNKHMEFNKCSKNNETHNNLSMNNNQKDNILDKNNKMIDKNLLKKKTCLQMNSFNSGKKMYDNEFSKVKEKKKYNERKVPNENNMENQRYEDDKMRRKYLSEGFSAYVHIALSEDTIISKKCIISCNINSKMLKIEKNQKSFIIDMNKLDVQEIPTPYDDLAIIKLISKKKNNNNSNCLLVESKNLRALQHLGDEIGWNYDKTGYSMDHKFDDEREKKERRKTDDEHINNKPQLIDNITAGFFDRIKLNKFLGKKKKEEKDI
ncbi:conserved Plasmodium protein, unknown function, partial [Plasmodium sp. DRC-Itaito]